MYSKNIKQKKSLHSVNLLTFSAKKSSSLCTKRCAVKSYLKNNLQPQQWHSEEGQMLK